MVGLSNTVSPMQVTLPGEPKSQGYNNAQAHVDSIVAAKALATLAQNSTIVDPTDFTADMAELARDCLWNEGDGSFALRDAISDYIIAQPLSITERGHRNSWSDGWETDHFEILLSTGGPSLVLRCAPDSRQVDVVYQDFGSPEHSLPTTEDEREALTWFASQVCC